MKKLFLILIIMSSFVNGIPFIAQKSLSLTKQNGSQRQTSNKSYQNNNKRRRGGGRNGRNRASISSTPLWPGGTVYYKIDNSLSSHRRLIQNAMRKIESNSCIQFRQRTNQQNYIQFFSGDGCYSSVGRVGGRQYLSLGYGCHDIGSAMHEILHALGFYHEHMRADRDRYVTINRQNIESGMQDQFSKVPESKNHLYTKFDFSSIMIYGRKAFSKNGKETMTPKVQGARMVESHYKTNLSPLDISTLNQMYRCN